MTTNAISTSRARPRFIPWALVAAIAAVAAFAASSYCVTLSFDATEARHHLPQLVELLTWSHQQLNNLTAPAPPAYAELGVAARERRAQLVAADRETIEHALPSLRATAAAANDCLAILGDGGLMRAWNFRQSSCREYLANVKLALHGSDGIDNYDPVAKEIVDQLHLLTPLASTANDKARLAAAFHKAMAVFIGPINNSEIHSAPNAFIGLEAEFSANAIPMPNSHQ